MRVDSRLQHLRARLQRLALRRQQPQLRELALDRLGERRDGVAAAAAVRPHVLVGLAVRRALLGRAPAAAPRRLLLLLLLLLLGRRRRRFGLLLRRRLRRTARGARRGRRRQRAGRRVRGGFERRRRRWRSRCWRGLHGGQRGSWGARKRRPPAVERSGGPGSGGSGCWRRWRGASGACHGRRRCDGRLRYLLLLLLLLLVVVVLRLLPQKLRVRRPPRLLLALLQRPQRVLLPPLAHAPLLRLKLLLDKAQLVAKRGHAAAAAAGIVRAATATAAGTAGGHEPLGEQRAEARGRLGGALKLERVGEQRVEAVEVAGGEVGPEAAGRGRLALHVDTSDGGRGRPLTEREHTRRAINPTSSAPRALRREQRRRRCAAPARRWSRALLSPTASLGVGHQVPFSGVCCSCRIQHV